MTEFIKDEELENKPFSFFDDMEREETFTEGEVNQARLLFNYLASSNSNKELYQFINKALVNIRAKDIREYRARREKEREKARLEAFKASLPYNDN